MDDIKRLLWEAWGDGWKYAGNDPSKRFIEWFDTVDLKAWLIAAKAEEELENDTTQSR